MGGANIAVGQNSKIKKNALEFGIWVQSHPNKYRVRLKIPDYHRKKSLTTLFPSISGIKKMEVARSGNIHLYLNKRTQNEIQKGSWSTEKVQIRLHVL